MLPEIHHEMNLFLMNKNRKWGLERLLSGDKELLCHHEDLVQIPNTDVKSQTRLFCLPAIPALRKKGRMERTHWLACLGKNVNFQFNERPCLKAVRQSWRNTANILCSGFLMRVHASADPHVCTTQTKEQKMSACHMQ